MKFRFVVIFLVLLSATLGGCIDWDQDPINTIRTPQGIQATIVMQQGIFNGQATFAASSPTSTPIPREVAVPTFAPYCGDGVNDTFDTPGKCDHITSP